MRKFLEAVVKAVCLPALPLFFILVMTFKPDESDMQSFSLISIVFTYIIIFWIGTFVMGNLQ
jgi:hypothetical protein